MPTLVISGQVIDFPNDAASPDWAPGVIAFAKAVTAALQGLAGTGDVSPQIMSLDSYNAATDIPIPFLDFPVNSILSFTVSYAITRSTSTTTFTDAGTLTCVYNARNTTNNKWEVNRRSVTDSGGNMTFKVSDGGVVSFSTTSIGTQVALLNKLVYSAKVLPLI